ncbi:MAG TPA: DUF2652 domain-containing protein [Anaerolineales bacterium]|nr:DUF2652 domain-containing protein [Anaerolineales bacterium]
MTVNVTQHGYFLLADISGYTSFVAGTELEHSQDILSELLEVIITKIKPQLTIHKIEGDAVFAFAPEQRIPRGETLFELIESTYVAFRDKRESAHRRTTCTCNACRAITTLDLKFIAHHGDYFEQDIMGTRELVGTDVNLIHRLLKNRVTESTGWKAYAMFTAQGLEHLSLQPDGLFESMESYEHIGNVNTYSLDLHQRYKEIVEARRVFVSPGQAHHMLEFKYASPPHVIWEWFNDPFKRGQWMHSEIVPILRPRGRIGAGARNHCVHGRNQVIVEDVLDIRPIEYYTVRHTPQGLSTSILLTFHFTPTQTGGTNFRLFLKGEVPFLPEWLKKIFCKIIVHQQLLKLWRLEGIDELINTSVVE